VERPVDGETVVVGAGLAGLMAARMLAADGRPVLVLEAADQVGGRLATRRLGTGLFDHGAQFFTVRSDVFAAEVEKLCESGVVYEWCRGFNEVDGYPRFAARHGMQALAEHLAAGLDVRTGTVVEAVAPSAGGCWTVHGRDIEIDAAAVLLTSPVPLSLALLDAGRVALNPAHEQGVRDLRYHSVLAVMAVLDRPSAIPSPGGRQLADGPFSFVADNAAKGLSPIPTVTLHAAHDLSAARWDDDPAVVLPELLELARPWLGAAEVVQAELVHWAHAGPVMPWPDRCCEVAPGVVLAGDAFGGPKVEGAYLSGRAAGEALR
jgi:predicted NAD/FAD-dependent oxidoreductase